MPIIQIHLLEGRSTAQKRAMIAEVTQAVVRTLGVHADSVRILIDEMQPEHFAVSGLSAGERPLAQRSRAASAVAHAEHRNGVAAE